jgi:hypothetical protein
VSFSLLGQSLKEDGTLELIAPSLFEKTIPSFNMAWILEIWEHYLYSGRQDAVMRLMPAVKKIIRTCMGNMREGLLVTPVGDRYWNFYEWADGMNGYADQSTDTVAERVDAPLNLFFHIALVAAARLAEAAGEHGEAEDYRRCADVINEHFHGKFWDDARQLYRTYAGGAAEAEHFAELTQALALYAGLCPAQLAYGLRQKLAMEDNGMVKATLSYSIYKYEALLGEPDRYARTVFDGIVKDWGYMLYHGATSFWETIKGGDDFDKAGSLYHGWSAIPVYFYYAYLLGVKPVEPGFKVFSVQPVRGILPEVSGKVPTPYGDIWVSYETGNGSTAVQVSSPEGIVMQLDATEA